MLDRFLAIYEIQRSGTVFQRPEELLRALDLYKLTDHTMACEMEVNCDASSCNAVKGTL